jgi:DNA mismatch endonuclease (patch repair protein)
LGYWLPKLDGNKSRDGYHLEVLKEAGWDALIVWECEAEGDQGLLLNRLKIFLD